MYGAGCREPEPDGRSHCSAIAPRMSPVRVRLAPSLVSSPAMPAFSLDRQATGLCRRALSCEFRSLDWATRPLACCEYSSSLRRRSCSSVVTAARSIVMRLRTTLRRWTRSLARVHFLRTTPPGGRPPRTSRASRLRSSPSSRRTSRTPSRSGRHSRRSSRGFERRQSTPRGCRRRCAACRATRPIARSRRPSSSSWRGSAAVHEQGSGPCARHPRCDRRLRRPATSFSIPPPARLSAISSRG
jgi:hypothetical protein